MNHVVEGRNVNHLWARAVPLLWHIGERSSSRAGDVLVAPGPVLSVTHAPTERVLFDPARDANPFFHFFECLWMLAGRRDAAFLDRFVGDFGSRFAEKNGTLWGAYGHRWRGHFMNTRLVHRFAGREQDQRIDQLDVAVRRLSENPDDRRTVISMWQPEADLWDPEDRAPDDENEEPRDLPCNTHIYLRVRDDKVRHYSSHDGTKKVDMEFGTDSVLDVTVCCRSNDIVWGAYGANAVHFSFLQEYLAGRLGVGVGRLYQLSNNWHAYVPVLERYTTKADLASVEVGHALRDPYAGGTVQPMPIGTAWSRWDDDLRKFFKWTEDHLAYGEYRNRWFETVVMPMYSVHSGYKSGNYQYALRMCDEIAASDWARAAREWLLRRIK